MLITLLIAPMFIYIALITIGGLFSIFSAGRPKSVELTEIEKREQERYEWLNSGTLRY